MDLDYTKNNEPKIAVEVLIGHGKCYVIIEIDVNITVDGVERIVERIEGCLDIYPIIEK